MKNKNNHKLRFFFALSIILSVLSVCFMGVPVKQAKAAPEATIYFDPASVSTSSGQEFSLNAMINPGSNQVYGVDAYISFDPTKVHVTSITGNTASFPIVLSAGTYNNTSGTASISLATGISNPPAITSATIVATFSFQAVGDGNISISFTDGQTIAIAKNESGNVITTSTPAQITISAKTYGNSDFAVLAADWLQTKTSAADVNADGIINARDLGIMMSHWAN